MFGASPSKHKPSRAEPSMKVSVKSNPTVAKAKGKYEMAQDIGSLSNIAGFIGGCLVDSESGMVIVSEGGGSLDLEVAGAANSEVVKAKLAAMDALGLKDAIEDVLITLGKQFHLIRPLAKNPQVFLYLALDKKAANLALARIELKKIEGTLDI